MKVILIITFDTDVPCVGTINKSETVITSPNFPQRYDHGLNCSWTVLNTPRGRLELDLVFIDIDNSTCLGCGPCSKDSLQIRELGGMRSWGPMCGLMYSRQKLVVFGNNTMIEFKTNEIASGLGFVIKIQRFEECSKLLTDQTGIIRFPGSGLGHDKDCKWVIPYRRGHTTTLGFRSFDIERNSYCTYDRIYIYEMTSTGKEINKQGPLCGSSDTINITDFRTRSNDLILHFMSDGSRSSSFTVYYKQSLEPFCGGTLSGAIGSVVSPLLADVPYPVSCTWTLPQNTKNHKNSVTVIIPQGQECVNRMLQVNEVDSLSPKSMITNCSQQQYLFESTGHGVNITLASNAKDVPFSFMYKSQLVEKCSFSLTSSKGFISPPSFPSPPETDVDCTWQIKYTEDDEIYLNLTYYNIELVDCAKNYLEISETNPRGQHWGPWCSDMPRDLRINSTIRDIQIRYVAEANQQNIPSMPTGFFILFKKYKIYTLKYTTDSGVIKIPTYKNFIDINVKCRWTIAHTQHYETVLNFTQSNTSDCSTSHVMVSETNPPGSVWGPYCLHINIGDIHTKSHDLLVTLIAENTTHINGFSMSFTKIEACGDVLDANSGEVVSPEYPNFYPNDLSCSWVITNRPGQQITVWFVYLSVENHLHCDHDNISLTDVGGNNKSITFCGEVLPPTEYIYKDKDVRVDFYTDHNTQKKGFQLNFNRTSYSALLLTTPDESTSLTASSTLSSAAPVLRNDQPSTVLLITIALSIIIGIALVALVIGLGYWWHCRKRDGSSISHRRLVRSSLSDTQDTLLPLRPDREDDEINQMLVPRSSISQTSFNTKDDIPLKQI